MIWLFEAAGMAALGGVVWIFFSASRERPDQPGLRTAAYIALFSWIGFGVLLLIDSNVFESPLALMRNALILAAILAVVMGYRRVLAHIRRRASGE